MYDAAEGGGRLAGSFICFTFSPLALDFDVVVSFTTFESWLAVLLPVFKADWASESLACFTSGDLRLLL